MLFWIVYNIHCEKLRVYLSSKNLLLFFLARTLYLSSIVKNAQETLEQSASNFYFSGIVCI